ncbi:hypothetical protein LXL04_028240 [Taraxacum kok-saghyz]
MEAETVMFVLASGGEAKTMEVVSSGGGGRRDARFRVLEWCINGTHIGDQRAEERVEQRYRGRLVGRDREETRFMDESVFRIKPEQILFYVCSFVALICSLSFDLSFFLCCVYLLHSSFFPGVISSVFE